MLSQIILIIIILFTLRKRLRIEGLLAKWDKFIWGILLACFTIVILFFTVKQSRPFLMWVSYAISATILYQLLTKKEFAFTKSFLYAFLPLIVLTSIEDAIKVLNNPFYNTWHNYFEIAKMVCLIWMVIMLIMGSKQRKALEKERQINAEKEKEYQLIQKLKSELEVQVKERTAELTQQKEALQKTLHDLESTQTQLIHAEKMASLGELTAGIAHEIQNPLNFVNNFSEINRELLAELKEEINKGNTEEAKAIANDVIANEEKINQHGKRADSIVKGMLQHSRTSTGQKELTNINALCDECLRLSFHGLRAKDKTFNAGFETHFDERLPKINIVPQEIGRVLLNLCNNAFYAVNTKKKQADKAYKPLITMSTAHSGKSDIEIKMKDNGSGIPLHVIDKIFQPFFTTKPTGEGTGLGLSMSYEIITKGHSGTLKVESEENIGTTFIINLPF